MPGILVCNVGESTKLVSEYKAKLQISEAENAKLEGTVSICLGNNVVTSLASVNLLSYEIEFILL